MHCGNVPPRGGEVNADSRKEVVPEQGQVEGLDVGPVEHGRRRFNERSFDLSFHVSTM